MKVAQGQEACEQSAQIIRSGGVIAFRTDTFYGLGADPLNDKAVAQIRELKGREDTKPILLLISDESVVGRFIKHPPPLFAEVARRFWPGPLTIVGGARPELPEELTAGSGTIGLRLPDDEGLRDLVRICGGALTATSANLSGGEPAKSVEEVHCYFPTQIDLIIDGGEVSATKPSTVVDLSGTHPRLVREGAITASELDMILSR